MTRYSVQDIKAIARRMQTFLDTTPPKEPTEIRERLNELGRMGSKSGEMLADAEYFRDEKIVEATEESISIDLPASSKNQYIKARCKEENHLARWVGRINSSSVHQADILRTQISFLKTELAIQ